MQKTILAGFLGLSLLTLVGCSASTANETETENQAETTVTAEASPE